MKLFAVLLCFGFGFSAFAQDVEVGVTTVEVWVQVTDRSGAPIVDMDPQKFQIFEDGRKVELTCFQPPGQFQINDPQAATAKERLALYIDLFNTTPDEYVAIHPAMIDFIKRIDTSKWDLFVAVVDHEGRLKMVGPTEDKAMLSAYLEKQPANAARDRELRDERRELAQVLEKIVSEKGPDQLVENLISSAFKLARGYATREKNATEFSLAAFETFARALDKKIDGGHTSVLYISGGFNVDPGRFYYDLITDTLEQTTHVNDLTQLAVFSPESNRETNFDINREIQKSVGRLNRSDVTVYSLNTRTSLKMQDTAETGRLDYRDPWLKEDYQESLSRVADETGGIAFEDSNDFDVGFQKISYDVQNHYVLCYRPPERKPKGEYHKIQVKAQQDGVNLRYRKGYVD